MSKPQFNNIAHGLIYTFRQNLIVDYHIQLTHQQLNNILQIYNKLFQTNNFTAQIFLYQQLKTQLNNQQKVKEIQAVNWLEKQRSNKYDGTTIPGNKNTQLLRTIRTCLSPDHLIKIRKGTNSSQCIQFDHIYSQQKVELQTFYNGKNIKNMFWIATGKNNKLYLHKSKSYESQPPNNIRGSQTLWVCQKTIDNRYIWRGKYAIDKQDVLTLLKFILIKRPKQENLNCPSILLNAASHGNQTGQNAYKLGNLNMTDMKIYEQTFDSLVKLVQSKQYKLTQENIKRKVHINKLCTAVPCVYPQNADHIIDVQCYGARQKVLAQNLHHKNSSLLSEQKDLDFLSIVNQLETFKDFKLSASLTGSRYYFNDEADNQSNNESNKNNKYSFYSVPNNNTLISNKKDLSKPPKSKNPSKISSKCSIQQALQQVSDKHKYQNSQSRKSSRIKKQKVDIFETPMKNRVRNKVDINIFVDKYDAKNYTQVKKKDRKQKIRSDQLNEQNSYPPTINYLNEKYRQTLQIGKISRKNSFKYKDNINMDNNKIGIQKKKHSVSPNKSNKSRKHSPYRSPYKQTQKNNKNAQINKILQVKDQTQNKLKVQSKQKKLHKNLFKK